VNTDPHRGQPILRRGPDPASARLTVIVVHGRGASAADILSLADEFGVRDVAYLAPEAAGHTWYPYSFLAPMRDNEPFLSSALGVLDRIVRDLWQDHQIGPERVGLLGFSQGACLSLEYAARHARRYAAVVGLSGGLIGPPGTPRDYAGTMDGTPVFLGCSDVDPHIPLERVHETAEIFRRLGATVDERIYPHMGHLVNRDEIDAVSALLTATAP
jgi:predicted esterase